MPNFLLSGISAGANQGLANLVASKRADRMAARENRRYEQELMFRIGSAEQAKQEREKMFAYQQTRDATADKQWAESHGLQVEANAERRRANMASEQLGRDTLTSREAQAEADRRQSANQFNETMKYRYDAAEQAQQQFDATQKYRQDTLAESIAARQSSDTLSRERNQILDDYYDDQTEIARQRLNQPMSDIERQKIEAEIERLKAQGRYYDAQARGESGASVPSVPLATGRNIAQEDAKRYAEWYDDEGRAWQNPFTTEDLTGEPTWWDKNPFRTDRVLKWDSTDPNERTQKQKLQIIGGDFFENLVQTYGGNVQAAYQHLDNAINTMLDDPDFGDRVFERIRRALPTELSDGDDFLTIRNLARDEIRRGALLKHAELISPVPNNAGTDTDPALNFR